MGDDGERQGMLARQRGKVRGKIGSMWHYYQSCVSEKGKRPIRGACIYGTCDKKITDLDWIAYYIIISSRALSPSIHDPANIT